MSFAREGRGVDCNSRLVGKDKVGTGPTKLQSGHQSPSDVAPQVSSRCDSDRKQRPSKDTTEPTITSGLQYPLYWLEFPAPFGAVGAFRIEKPTVNHGSC